MNETPQHVLPSCLVIIMAVLVLVSLLFIIGAAILVLGVNPGGL